MIVFLICLLFYLCLSKGGDKSINVFPDPLDNLMGCTLAFKIKVQPKYRNSSVKKISDDPELMQPIMDLLPDVEVLSILS